MELLQQFIPVAVVLGALVLLVWAMKQRGWARIRTGPRDMQKRLEVIDRLVLTPHHSIHLIRLADRTLLVGLSPSGCNLLETSVASDLAQVGLTR